MIRTQSFALNALQLNRRIHILSHRESFLCTSTTSLNITRGVKKRRPREPTKSHVLNKTWLDPLESIKPPKSSDNDTSKLFKVCINKLTLSVYDYLSTCTKPS